MPILQLYSGRSKSLNLFSFVESNDHLFILSTEAPVGRYSECMYSQRPAAMGLAVVGEGHPWVSNRPDDWLIGSIEKPKTVRKKKTSACGLGRHKRSQNF